MLDKSILEIEHDLLNNINSDEKDFFDTGLNLI